MHLQTIAKIHNDFTQKFGVPRQSGLAPSVQSRIVFEPEFANEDALRGIEGFSHLWIIWQFDRAQRLENVDAQEKSNQTWHPTVRPPRLGGNTRLGVFATRSPYRPNGLGLSVVVLERVENNSEYGPVLHVSGADIMNNTPIFDIKPYLPYADSYPFARDGFVEGTCDATKNANTKTEENITRANCANYKFLIVEISATLKKLVPREKLRALEEVLACDPRPAYHHDPGRVYHMEYGGLDVSFCVKDETLRVTDIKHL